MSNLSDNPVLPFAQIPQRILIVEDEPLIGMLIADQLVELNYLPVGPAGNAADGLQLANVDEVDCVLLDWNLGGRSSAEIANVLTQRKIPFVIVTGYIELPDAAYRGIAILKKPFLLSELQAALEKALAGC